MQNEALNKEVSQVKKLIREIETTAPTGSNRVLTSEELMLLLKHDHKLKRFRKDNK